VGAPHTGPAQRRPGPEPQRHSVIIEAAGIAYAAQRRPGPEPQRHLPLADARAQQHGHRSTKAGARTPATLRRTLRPVNDCTRAQRRPGPEPQRHRPAPPGPAPRGRRSTKAGARTPATLLNGVRLPNATYIAQRRPGPEPQRHSARVSYSRTRRIHAQRRPGPEPQRHQIMAARAGAEGAPLNEGRGPNPSDTRCAESGQHDGRPRSTKAGARTPATHDRHGRGGERLVRRSTKAGARTPATPPIARWNRPSFRCAQRRPGPEPQRHPSTRRAHHLPCTSLNEGRGPNPSDTSGTWRCLPHHRALNEGRGPNPSDTVGGGRPLLMSWSAQRRPGPEPQRHPPCAATRDPGTSAPLNEGRGPNPSDTP